MIPRALFLVHRGPQSTARIVKILREKGFEPFVLSSLPFDGGATFAKLCGELEVVYEIAPTGTLSPETVLGWARTLPDCRFCFGVWEGHRHAMALTNRLLGAHDVSPESILLAQDKHLFRKELVARGLSKLRPSLLSDPELRRRLEAGERVIVKPRRGAGSLFTRAVSSWAQAEALQAAFRRGPGENDLFEEFFVDNELAAETFFDGRELSVELIRQGGRTVLACEHEKTVLDFTGDTVLERGLASPAVALSAAEVRAATALAETSLDALGLSDGCYHVELRVGADGACEIIEINPRIGGGFIYESVLLQLERSMLHDWIDTLAGRAVPAFDGERRCGTYFQLAFPDAGRELVALEKRADLPTPEQHIELMKPGSPGRDDREQMAAMTLWRTRLATHVEEVALLAHEEYVTMTYANDEARVVAGR
jgi:hypothetical protein